MKEKNDGEKVVGAGEGLILTEHLHTPDSVFRAGFTISFNPLCSSVILGTMIIPSVQMGETALRAFLTTCPGSQNQ